MMFPTAIPSDIFERTLIQRGIIEKLRTAFHERSRTRGYIAQEGAILDASFVAVPKQANSREDNKKIKEGELPEGWDDPAKMNTWYFTRTEMCAG